MDANVDREHRAEEATIVSRPGGPRRRGIAFACLCLLVAFSGDASCEEGWVLHEVVTWPKGGERDSDYDPVNLDWRSDTLQRVEVGEDDSETSRAFMRMRYFDQDSDKLLADYRYEAVFTAPPKQLRAGQLVPVSARARRTTKGHFADHSEYTSPFTVGFHGRGGSSAIYIPETGTREVKLPDGTDDADIEAEFKTATLEDARRSVEFANQSRRRKIVPEIRIVAYAGVYGEADRMVIEWRYRIGEVLAPGPEILSLEAFDANPGSWTETDLVGGAPKASALILAEDTRAGACADGASALILRAEVSDEAPVVFHVLGDVGGELEPLFESRTLTLKERHYAFARYRPPEALPGESGGETSTLKPPKRRFGGETGPEAARLEIQAVPYRVTSDGKGQPCPEGSKIAELELVRPPVVLVHGLFSNAVQCWRGVWGEGKSLSVLLEKAGFVPFHVNYPRSNGSGGEFADAATRRASDFGSNWDVVWSSPDEDIAVEKDVRWMEGDTGWLGVGDEPILSEFQRTGELRLGGIEEALRYYRDELDLAATQADVVGHSMGGLLPRVYASPSFNEEYLRPENFERGDINRLLTVNTPHFGSDLADLVRLLRPARIGDEALADWTRRFVALGLFRGLFASADNGALNDLGRHSANLHLIGETAVPAFAIATHADHGQLGVNEHDPGKTYLMAYSGIGMLLFYNPGLLEAAIGERAREWREAGEWQRSTAQDGRTPGASSVGSYGAVDFSDEVGARRFFRLVHSGFDESVYYWSRYRETEYREDLRSRIQDTALVAFGLYDAFEGAGWVEAGPDPLERFASFVSSLIVGGDVARAQSDDVEPDIPHEVVDGLRTLIFHGDSENDGAVRVVSQLGGLPERSTRRFPGIVHSFSPWDFRVQREVIRLLRWGNEEFSAEGFPATAQPMPHWLPSPALAETRVYGDLAVDWSGMVRSHAEAYLSVADREDVVVLVRPINQDSTALIEGGAATKGMAIKGKSSNWGPQRGLLTVRQRFSKIWRTKSGTERDADIEEYDAINQAVLNELTYPEDPEAPELEGRRFAVARELDVQVAGEWYDVLIDPDPAVDAEDAVFLRADGKLFDWRTGTEERAGESVAIFDRDTAPTTEIEGARRDEVLRTAEPMMVLADNLSDVEPKPYLTADYDLLAIGFRRTDDFHGVPRHVKRAQKHDLRGYISGPQLDIVNKLNQEVFDTTDYRSSDLTHHGPEVQFAKSPHVDYPILVFDPMDEGEGDGEMFIIRQGPVGFRDIHLKRYFAEKIREKFNLWPNPDSKGWSWESYRPFSRERGYDVRDAPDLKAYVAEQRRPQRSAPRVDPAASSGGETGGDPEEPPAPKIEYGALGADELAALAEDGDAKARNLLGVRYAKGEGVPKSEDMAREQFRIAAEAGLAAAQANYARRFYSGIGVEKDYAKAYEWYLKSAEQDHGPALSVIGYMYEKGQHVASDLDVAVEWYEKGLARKDRGSMNRIGVLSREGRGVPRDYDRAAELFRRSAERGDSFGQEQLGLMYAKGLGTKVDTIEAYAWLNLAAAGGDTSAAKTRDTLEKRFDRNELRAAQKRSREIRESLDDE